MNILEKINTAKNLAELNALREDVAEEMLNSSRRDFLVIQDAFRKAKNKLKYRERQ